jgi:hypothetical protein
MTDDLQKPEVSLVKRLRESGTRSEVELHEDREEAADRIDQLVATNEALERERDHAWEKVAEADTRTIQSAANALAAEARLAKAVEAMMRAERIIRTGQPDKVGDAGTILRASLAEIEGGKKDE